jgi:hypothetical protein
VNRIYYFRFDDYSGAWIIVLPQLGKIWKSFLTAYATRTKTTENNHDKAGGNHSYV